MVSKESREAVREEKHRRTRSRPSGTVQRPCLLMFRSNNHIHAQIIDDAVGCTLVAASTLEREVKGALEHTDTVEAAAYVDRLIAGRAKGQGASAVIFDRGEFLYTDKVQAFASAAHEAGLQS